jgi:hypothetical protein
VSEAPRDGVGRLREEIRAAGGLLAGGLLEDGRPPGAGARGPAQVASAGPRAAADPDAYELLVEAIREGYLLHYGRSRVLEVDPDLALLAGDQLFALGMARLAQLGDLEATAELADVISLCAEAHAAGDDDLAEAVWEAGAIAVGWGATPELRAAKDRARRGDAGAAAALRAAALHAERELAPKR